MKRHSTLVLGIVATLAIGCKDETPRAPALRDSPVYQNESAGLRFLVPERWRQAANSNLPEGPLEREVQLARYNVNTSAAAASLEILCMTTDDTFNAVEYHSGPSFGITEWKLIEKPQTVTLGAEEGSQMLLEGEVGGDVYEKEVTTIRRGNRTFHFIGLYSQEDHNARQQIQRAIQSVAWK